MTAGMNGTLKIMRGMILSWNRGRFVYTDDFASLESQGSVRIALCTLVKEGLLHRLARGIYYYPQVSGGHRLQDKLSAAVRGNDSVRRCGEGAHENNPVR